MNKAILKDKKVIPTDNLSEWARWFETSDRIVKQTTLKNGYRVSTVFLGIDYGFGLGKSLWFETMVFAGGNFSELDLDRSETWEEAEAGHKAMVAKWRKHK